MQSIFATLAITALLAACGAGVDECITPEGTECGAGTPRVSAQAGE